MKHKMKLVIGEERVLAEGFELPIWLWELLMKESKKAKENYNQESFLLELDPLI